MSVVDARVPGNPVVPRTGQPVALATLTAVAVAFVAAWLVERGNAPFTLNFVTPVDQVVGVVMFSVPLLGFVVLALRPGNRTGWLMLASGVSFALYLVAHAVAVRLLLVSPTAEPVGLGAAWLATWLLVPGFGLLPFVLATWPDGRIGTPWLRVCARGAAAALALLTLAQAFAPENVEGVAVRPIRNPLGAAGDLTTLVDVVTLGGIAVLAAFTLAAAADAVARTVQARGERRRQLVPVVLVLLSVPLVALTALPGGIYGVWAAAVVAITGTGAALVVASRGIRRAERTEQARWLLVAEREDERRRLRRELHDGIGPLLAALRLELDRVPEPGQVAGARGLLDDAFAEVRRISRDLRPAALDEIGLVGALRQQVARLTAPGGPVIDVDAPDRLPALPAAVEVAVLRIAGEALTNTVRHAGAGRCRVTLTVDDAVRLRVSDDGSGLGGGPGGVGLRSMRERTEELGGRFEVRAGDRGGTVVEAVLPLRPAPSGATGPSGAPGPLRAPGPS